MIKKPSADIQFLALTLLLVCGLGVQTFASLMTSEDGKVLESEAGAAPVLAGGRQPASTQGAKTGKRRSDHFAHHDIRCKRTSLESIPVAGDLVQFQGKFCLKGLKAADVEIINQKNGFTASVFISGANQYQTDLIQLEQGENEILIRYRDASGGFVEELLKVHSS